MPVRDRKPGRLDQMRRHAEAGAKPENRSGILGDVGLVKCEVHEAIQTLFQGMPRGQKATLDERFVRLFIIVANTLLHYLYKGANKRAVGSRYPLAGSAVPGPPAAFGDTSRS